ncbi:Hypothetical protein CBG17932 [Anopheles sinensis]|uniref:Uncharacterized protein n=1 Tax=Anopheles sinensis TaxID=74873 RepID=A0A084W0R2_ANOSI|nr:Hypothetical protein CBG17932 [Anopheles sinensis]
MTARMTAMGFPSFQGWVFGDDDPVPVFPEPKRKDARNEKTFANTRGWPGLSCAHGPVGPFGLRCHGDRLGAALFCMSMSETGMRVPQPSSRTNRVCVSNQRNGSTSRPTGPASRGWPISHPISRKNENSTESPNRCPKRAKREKHGGMKGKGSRFSFTTQCEWVGEGWGYIQKNHRPVTHGCKDEENSGAQFTD